MMHTDENIDQLLNATAYDRDGDKIGRVSGIYLDDQTSQPMWVTIHTGLFGLRTSFAPLAGSSLEGDRLVLAHGSDVVKEAPNMDEDGHLDRTQEDELYRYYNVESAHTDADRTRTRRWGARHQDDDVIVRDDQPRGPGNSARNPVTNYQSNAEPDLSEGHGSNNPGAAGGPMGDGSSSPGNPGSGPIGDGSSNPGPSTTDDAGHGTPVPEATIGHGSNNPGPNLSDLEDSDPNQHRVRTEGEAYVEDRVGDRTVNDPADRRPSDQIDSALTGNDAKDNSPIRGLMDEPGRDTPSRS